METLESVGPLNQQRMLVPLSYVTPVEFEARFHDTQHTHAAAGVLN
jgi:hypothetical protein